ncbi:hypothetical protein [Mycolicibacterium iranicum]|uniref:Antitoxin VbhA domain-containing protein n=1 Tax=Mycolicibacterium iranicum TaxID=912594 RepID=A0ABT4HJU9_MYCIR|nr:hypothetical protein [Mycolicibacterium iranicum]MCZ0730475.1 hypothetical protein [Mycolicibacterium iranicum]
MRGKKVSGNHKKRRDPERMAAARLIEHSTDAHAADLLRQVSAGEISAREAWLAYTNKHTFKPDLEGLH